MSPDTPEITSHTSTQQWQSFEFRMRARRAERCLLRAEMALEGGLEDEAREAIDEAERLNSSSPKLAELRSLLAARTAASVVAYEAAHHAAGRQRWLRALAMAAIFLTVGAVAFLITLISRSDSPAVLPTRSANTAPAPTPPGPVVTVPESAPAPVPDLASNPIAAVEQVDPPVAEPERPLPEPSTPASTPPRVQAAAPSPETKTTETRPQVAPSKTPLPEFDPQFVEARPVALPPVPSPGTSAPARNAPLPSAPDAPPAMPAPATAASAGTLDRMGETLPASNVPAPERRPAPENPALEEEPRVRAVLARYEAAYSGLNASAAQEVWPAVDERSLARAFDTLESQRVSLGRCSVQVEGTSASASCNGSVTWTPKVGGGSQTAARQWRFQLQSGGGTWQITRAEVK